MREGPGPAVRDQQAHDLSRNDRAVDVRERGEVFRPAEDASKEETTDCNGEMDDATRKEESSGNTHAVDFNRLNTTAVNPVGMAT